MAPSNRQPSFYSKYIKYNVRSRYNICLMSNSKYTRSITLNSLLVPLLITIRVLGLIYY